MADVIFFSSHLSSSSLLTILPSPSQSSTSLSPIHRKPFKKNCIYGARDASSADFMSGRRLRSSFKRSNLNLKLPYSCVRFDQFILLIINAANGETEQPKWWEKNAGPNMIDIHSTQEFLNSLSVAGEKLVIVEFYGTWCASCRALFPKLCRTAEEHPEILFLKVNFDANKRMCKSLNVKVLPYFHFYRGADGQLESFSCSLAKLQKIKDAIQMHNTDRCSIGPPRGVGDLALELTKD